MTQNNINTTNNKYYFCYSSNLYKEIKLHNIKYISKSINPSTNRTFWIYEQSDQLSNILTTWSNNKPINTPIKQI
jgi:hypothetical protein